MVMNTVVPWGPGSMVVVDVGLKVLVEVRLEVLDKSELSEEEL